MDERKSHMAFESQDPPIEVRPIFDIVYHHSMSEHPEGIETVSASETTTVRLGDLPDESDVSQGPHFRETMCDSLITLRVSHRYLRTMGTPEKSSNDLGETSPDSAEKPSQESPLEPIADQAGNWSSALFDLYESDPDPTLLSEDPEQDEDGFTELNQFCYFCQQLCKTSRALNTYVHEEDAAMPRQEPSPTFEPFRKLPHRQIREYFDFWPSSAEMLLSARSGCHLCTIICQQLIERLDLYHKFGCVNHHHTISIPAGLAKLPGNHNFPGCPETVPTSGPLKLVVCWTWWLTNPCVVRDIFMAWPLKGRSNDASQGSSFLRSQHYVALKYLDVDAVRTQSGVISHGLAGPWGPQESPKLGTGNYHLLSNYTGSDSWLKQADEWISECHREHSCHEGPGCNELEMSFSPTRLLDVGDLYSLQSPRLHIKQSNSGRVKYLALSHCWGQNSKSLYKLTKETEEELMQGVPVEKLSRTFQDAIRVCRKLNHRYIWIDSLCIKQDDPDDWIQEAAQMHLVYANSYCTIAAVCARGSEEGFLRWRNPRILQICNLPTNIWVGIWSLLRNRREPLFSRAWTLQERLLSPCVLKFGQTSIGWRCQEYQVDDNVHRFPSEFEISPPTFMRMWSALDLGSKSIGQRIFLIFWSRLMRTYTRMDLTNPRDRTFAFQGINSHIARLSGRAANGCGTKMLFFDGLPVTCLLPSLLWAAGSTTGERPDQNVTADSAKIRVETACYANTLSWASIEGVVSYPRQWPLCAASSPRTTIFAPGFSSGNFTLKKRTQVVRLYPSRNGCEAAEDNRNNDTPVESDHKSPVPRHPSIYQRYRYCTRVLSLIHVQHLLSRVTLEGPVFSFTTECTYGPSRVFPGRDDTFWDHPIKRNSLNNMFNLILFDLAFLRFSQTRLAIDVTCLTVVEWEDAGGLDGPKDMGGEDSNSWQPDCAAGIVLIRNDSGGEDGEYEGICGGGQEFYTRIGYWELNEWDRWRPPYRPIREEAKVRRVVVI